MVNSIKFNKSRQSHPFFLHISVKPLAGAAVTFLWRITMDFEQEFEQWLESKQLQEVEEFETWLETVANKKEKE